jgi:ADP-ribose pyrophosphatase YjhB (NUDIX family)
VFPPRPEPLEPRVGVGVLIVTNAGEVVLTLRRRAPEAGCWSIAGGKVEYMETLEAAAIREAREETGLDVALVRLLCVTDHRLPAEGQHWVAPAYLARVVGGQLVNREPEKAVDVRAFAIDALPTPLTMTAEAALRALGALGALGTADEHVDISTGPHQAGAGRRT